MSARRSTKRPRVRPRFELESPLPIERIRERVRAAIDGDERVSGMVLESRVELWPDDDSQHFFSPQLTVDMQSAGGGAALRARFGPAPHVWTFYVALHAIGAIGTLAAGIFGLSQYVAGGSPWALWALPASPVLAALVWALAFVGQGISADQMYHLRRVLEDAATASDSPAT